MKQEYIDVYDNWVPGADYVQDDQDLWSLFQGVDVFKTDFFSTLILSINDSRKLLSWTDGEEILLQNDDIPLKESISRARYRHYPVLCGLTTDTDSSRKKISGMINEYWENSPDVSTLDLWGAIRDHTEWVIGPSEEDGNDLVVIEKKVSHKSIIKYVVSTAKEHNYNINYVD